MTEDERTRILDGLHAIWRQHLAEIIEDANAEGWADDALALIPESMTHTGVSASALRLGDAKTAAQLVWLASAFQARANQAGAPDPTRPN